MSGWVGLEAGWGVKQTLAEPRHGPWRGTPRSRATSHGAALPGPGSHSAMLATLQRHG